MLHSQEYYYHGKLLLTGEYYVLDGATALAVPTKLGQRFIVSDLADDTAAETEWTIYYPERSDSRYLTIEPQDWQLTVDSRKGQVHATLMQILKSAQELGTDSRGALQGKQVKCYLEFPANWGLGSSSTLISFLAEYLGVNPYALLAGSFGGSGYDLACANAVGPLLYRRSDAHPEVTPLNWQVDWLDQTYFVYLNRKQNSREGIATYRKAPPSPETLAAITALTLALTDDSLHLRAAARLVHQHERLIAETLNLQPVGELFADFKGTVKSLGAWGGDFVWVLSEEPAAAVEQYFKLRGYNTFLTYRKMML